MKFTSYNGISFASLNVSASLPNDTPDRPRDPLVISRVNAPGLLAGMTGGVRTIPVYFMVKPGFNVEDTILTLLATLDLDNPEPRSLRGQLNDGSTNVHCWARPGSYIARPEDKKGILIPFHTDDLRWTAVSTTSDGPITFATDGSRTFTVLGQGRVNPLVKIAWTEQRAFFSSIVGWTKRKRITVTNNSTQNLYNYPIQIGPVDTAALVSAGKMQANGADWVAFNERGERLRKGHAGTSTRAAFLTFVVDMVAAGTSKTFDVCYGNPNALYDGENNGFPFDYPGSPTIAIDGIDGQASGATTSTLSTGMTLDALRFRFATMIITGGDTAVGGQMRRIASHTTGGIFTLTRDFTTTPNTNSGYVVVSGPFMGDGGQASAVTGDSLTDSSQSWKTNEWKGARVEMITLISGGLGTVTNWANVTGNTATRLDIDAWDAGTPGSTIYRVWKKNANWVYRVDQGDRDQTNFRGRWRINEGGVRPSQLWFAADGAPCAWSPATYNPNNAQYDANQLRYSYIDVGGGDSDSFALLNASLAKKDSGRSMPDRGFANGVEISVPLGVLGVRQDFRIKNPNGMARAFFGCKARGGEDWSSYYEYPFTQATLTTVSDTYYDLTGLGTPRHLIAALSSDDDGDVDKTETGLAQLIDNEILEIRVDASELVVTDWDDAPEEDIYDLTLAVRRGPASESIGDDLIRIGRNGRHLFLADGETIQIGEIGDVPLAVRIYDGSDYVRDVPWPVEIFHVAANAVGEETRYVSTDVLPFLPGSQTYRVSDPEGTIGELTIELVYRASYY
jgi:hypothetical protein